MLPWTYRTTLAGRRTGSTPRLRSVCGTAPSPTTTPSCLLSSACCCPLLSQSFVTGASSLIFNLPSSGFSEDRQEQHNYAFLILGVRITHCTLSIFLSLSVCPTLIAPESRIKRSIESLNLMRSKCQRSRSQDTTSEQISNLAEERSIESAIDNKCCTGKAEGRMSRSQSQQVNLLSVCVWLRWAYDSRIKWVET